MIDPKRRPERAEQLFLGRRIGELARERLARVAHRVLDELLLFAAPRRADADAMARARAQRRAQRVMALDIVREQHEPRRRPLQIELREKGVEHRRGAEAAVGAREIGAVAPVLVGAEEEHLDAELPRFLGDREHVGLGNALRVDALFALDRRQRGDAVTQPRRLLEGERFGRRLHLGGEPVADRPAAARQEIARLRDEPLVVGNRNLAGAGRRAALDLVEQAGARPILVIAVRTGAQQERALQRVEGAVDGAGACERAEIVALAGARAAMLEQLRRVVVAGD